MNIIHRIQGMFARKEQVVSPAPQTAAMWQIHALDEAMELLSRIPEADSVLTNAGIQRCDLKKLETDDDIYGALRTRRGAVVSTPWVLDGGSAAMVKLLKEELEQPMASIVAGAWSAVPYGYSVMEAVYRRRSDGGIGLASCMQKPIEWFDPRPDGELRYFPLMSNMAQNGQLYEVVDQTFKFMLTRNDWTYKAPHGEALLAKVYWPWYFRFNGWRFWCQFLERFGQPMLLGKSTDPTAMADALVRAHQDAVIAVGTQDSVEILSGGDAGAGFQLMEDCVVRRYHKLILGQTLTTDVSPTGGGSYALGQVHADVRDDLRLADLRMIRPTVQAVINALCILNGESTNIPKIKFEDAKGLAADRAERDTQLYGMGLRFTEDYYIANYDLKKDDFRITEQKAAPEVGEGAGEGEGGSQGERALLDEDGKPVSNEGGTKTKAKVPTKASMFAQRYANDPKRFTTAQQFLEDTADEALTVTGQPVYVEDIRAAVFAAKDRNDLVERLEVLMGESSSPQFITVLERALFVAKVIGYANAEGKV